MARECRFDESSGRGPPPKAVGARPAQDLAEADGAGRGAGFAAFKGSSVGPDFPAFKALSKGLRAREANIVGQAAMKGDLGGVAAGLGDADPQVRRRAIAALALMGTAAAPAVRTEIELAVLAIHGRAR